MGSVEQFMYEGKIHIFPTSHHSIEWFKVRFEFSIGVEHVPNPFVDILN